MVEHSVSIHADKDGNFRRQVSSFRNTISKDGPHPPEKGRYILYCALICPWASRTLHVRALKQLEDIVDVAIAHWALTPNGWTFQKTDEVETGDPVYGLANTQQLYLKADADYTARYTVPVLWDKKLGTIVNNESSEIIRILYTAFDELLPDDSPAKGKTYYPTDNAEATAKIDELNEWIYHSINNGVYKTGFATAQDVYDREVDSLFAALDRLEELLSDGRDYLVPEIGLSEADIRLYPTLARFDVAYHTLFRCNVKMIRHDYPYIHRYLRQLYWNEKAFSEYTNFGHIKKGYSTAGANKGLEPRGPLPHILPLDA
ncbi:related to ECM4-protein involved in cell wall biogenesis and architecture [Sporisorium reilianum SRZ2]|uniref:Related to ECM4-protein involved in cell wall biogenesis and architecture n=1 Tax=Sporisorium reilianum (strain SRZ2) TaxID=999809 RepID=E6ZWX1_SPORE|nr:related to ECM4-protein involved in cell wall biogenesis and architecture [Sporisorium reilianum SRZ2]